MRNVEISVVMSVFNPKAEYLREAIESILNQSFTNFEFIIVDDGCSEDIHDLLQLYKNQDERVIIIENQSNIGLTKSLNRAIAKARGRYIARMDADDISSKKRLQVQYQYMEKHPTVGVVGCFTSDGHRVQRWTWLASSEWRKVNMLFANYGIAHPSAFIRKDILDKYGITYNEQYKMAQDYDLWINLLRVSKMKVLPEILLFYRKHTNQISANNKGEQDICRDRIKINSLLELCDNVTEAETQQFLNLDNILLDDGAMCVFFNKLIRGNIIKKIYNQRILEYQLRRIWERRQHRKSKALLNCLKEHKNDIWWQAGYYWYLVANKIGGM